MTTIKFEQYKSLSGVNLGGFFQYHLQKNKIYLIGATGFEPATSRPPAVRATKLRHTPVRNIIARKKMICNSFIFDLLLDKNGMTC